MAESLLGPFMIKCWGWVVFAILGSHCLGGAKFCCPVVQKLEVCSKVSYTGHVISNCTKKLSSSLKICMKNLQGGLKIHTAFLSIIVGFYEYLIDTSKKMYGLSVICWMLQKFDWHLKKFVWSVHCLLDIMKIWLTPQKIWTVCPSSIALQIIWYCPEKFVQCSCPLPITIQIIWYLIVAWKICTTFLSTVWIIGSCRRPAANQVRTLDLMCGAVGLPRAIVLCWPQYQVLCLQ